MNRKKKLLTILLILLALSLTYRLMNPFRQQRVEQLTYKGGRRAKVTSKIDRSRPDLSEPTRRVLLPLVQKPPAHDGDAQKNIFSTDKQAGLIGPGAPKPTEKSAGGVLETARPVTPRETIFNAWDRFTVFGFFESENDMVLFLERGKEILTVRKGDRIDGRYEIVTLTKELITLKDLSTSQSVKIDLVDL